MGIEVKHLKTVGGETCCTVLGSAGLLTRGFGQAKKPRQLVHLSLGPNARAVRRSVASAAGKDPAKRGRVYPDGPTRPAEHWTPCLILHEREGVDLLDQSTRLRSTGADLDGLGWASE